MNHQIVPPRRDLAFVWEYDDNDDVCDDADCDYVFAILRIFCEATRTWMMTRMR